MEKEADSPSVCGSEEAGYLKTELFKQKTRFTSYIHRILQSLLGLAYCVFFLIVSFSWRKKKITAEILKGKDTFYYAD